MVNCTRPHLDTTSDVARILKWGGGSRLEDLTGMEYPHEFWLFRLQNRHFDTIFIIRKISFRKPLVSKKHIIIRPYDRPSYMHLLLFTK